MIYILKKRTGNFIRLSTNLIARKYNFTTLHFMKFDMEITTKYQRISINLHKKRDKKSFSHLKLSICCKFQALKNFKPEDHSIVKVIL